MVRSGRIVFGAMDEVVFGTPAAEAVERQVARLGASRVFLMASGTLNRETDAVAKIRRALGERCAGLFDKMPAHTPRSAVIAATAAAREAKADLIVTVGGGSITDGAKAVQMCLANDIRTPEAIDALRAVKGADGVVGPPPMAPPKVRQVSVPTTLSGGEFSAIAGVTDERTKAKELLRHPRVMPSAVVLDPWLTRHTPEWLFLSTGIRAVDHCVEGVCSNEANPFADAQALKGLALLARALPRVKADPADLAARLDCQMGTWLSMGPIAGGVPMGASHGIGYVLGALFGVPHGHTSCIMLPAVMRWNKQANAERQAEVAAAMGEAGRDAGDALDRLIRGLGMPRSLAAVKIGPENFERIAAQAMATPWVPRNPRPIAGPAQVREILEMAAG
ncbi:MAG TPA: iron-containing alcohol dehydrogenase [Stellaceae bacterium]|nr:iron-containing alcohol dehydrogenase [Stellaceae bacterium]